MPEPIQIPDFVVRQVGALTLQLAAAQEEIAGLRAELAAKPERAKPGR